jgi:acetyl-CoA synthetase
MGEFVYEKVFQSWKWNIPNEYNIGYDCIDKHAITKKKNKIALFWENAEGISEKFTFNDLKNLTNKFGNTLKNLGFKKTDRFLIRLPNIPEFQISFLGGVKIGAVPIPSSVMLKENEILYRLKDSRAKAIITTSDSVGEINRISEKCQSLEHIIIVDDAYGNQLSYNDLMKESSNKLEIESTKKEDIAFICYTSGSRNDPKGVVHLHQWVPANDPSLLFWQQGKDDDIIAHTGDLSWIYPLGNGFLYPLRHGLSTFIYHGRFDPEKWFELLDKYKITNLASVQTAYRMFLKIEDPMKKHDLTSLRHCISAGENLNPQVIKNWKKRFGLDIYEGIGKTEIMVYLSNYEGMKIKHGSWGKPQPGRICGIVDTNGKQLPPRESGILAIKEGDPGLFKEYLNKPDETMESFKNGWFLTGDIFYKDEEGYYWSSNQGDNLKIKDKESN